MLSGLHEHHYPDKHTWLPADSYLADSPEGALQPLHKKTAAELSHALASNGLRSMRIIQVMSPYDIHLALKGTPPAGTGQPTLPWEATVLRPHGLETVTSCHLAELLCGHHHCEAQHQLKGLAMQVVEYAEYSSGSSSSDEDKKGEEEEEEEEVVVVAATAAKPLPAFDTFTVESGISSASQEACIRALLGAAPIWQQCALIIGASADQSDLVVRAHTETCCIVRCTTAVQVTGQTRDAYRRECLARRSVQAGLDRPTSLFLGSAVVSQTAGTIVLSQSLEANAATIAFTGDEQSYSSCMCLYCKSESP
jgi:hypothetical protein